MERTLGHGFRIAEPGTLSGMAMAMMHMASGVMRRMAERRRMARRVAELNALPEHVRKDIGWVPWEVASHPVAPVGPTLLRARDDY
ncbi:MAG: hypothetical protein U1E14_06230 [Geminicoccaceae bacterium]